MEGQSCTDCLVVGCSAIASLFCAGGRDLTVMSDSWTALLLSLKFFLLPPYSSHINALRLWHHLNCHKTHISRLQIIH